MCSRGSSSPCSLLNRHQPERNHPDRFRNSGLSRLPIACRFVCGFAWKKTEKGGKLILKPRILLIPLILDRAGSQEVASSILASSTNKSFNIYYLQSTAKILS
jgi:hypothetical protein